MDADEPKWQVKGVWPLTTGENSIPNFEQWMLPWLKEYGYKPSEQSFHTDIACIAPSLYDSDTVYFWMNNNPAQEWALENGKEPGMFAALFRATATGSYPNREWAMEPYPVYYSDDSTFSAGWPRAVDPHLWNDDGEMYMTVGSWDPYGERVIVIAEMDRDTGRIAGLDPETPGYYKNAKSSFHPVTTFGEAAYSFKHGDYYYLFVNVGICCSGTDSTYAIVVGRSEDRYGPYVDHEGRSFMDYYPWPEERNDLKTFPGKLLIKSDGRYIGPGHPGIYTHDDGRMEMSFHYYDGDFAGLPKFSTREIAFNEQGWPYVVSDNPFRFA
jgi:beta-xylosidase